MPEFINCLNFEIYMQILQSCILKRCPQFLELFLYRVCVFINKHFYMHKQSTWNNSCFYWFIEQQVRGYERQIFIVSHWWSVPGLAQYWFGLFILETRSNEENQCCSISYSVGAQPPSGAWEWNYWLQLLDFGAKL